MCEYWRALGVGFCTIDQPQVSYAIGVTPVVTGPTGSLRRHGRKAAAWFAEDADAAACHDYRYAGEGLTALMAVAEAINAHARETYLIAKNHFRGQAVLNALELRHHLRRARSRSRPRSWPAIQNSVSSPSRLRTRPRRRRSPPLPTPSLRGSFRTGMPVHPSAAMP